MSILNAATHGQGEVDRPGASAAEVIFPIKDVDTPMRILVIEDDRDAADYLIKGLRESGYSVDHAPDGREGLSLALSESYDAMIVDRMLPGPDGLSIVEMVRKAGIPTPVLFLSALGDVEDRVSGLKAGGDDYLVKPFAFSELPARLRG